MKITMKKRAAILTAGILSAGILVSGVAVAAWLATGTGTGSAKALTATALTTTDVSSSSTAQLFPGATNAGTLTVKINNTNPYPVTVTDIAQDGTITATGGKGTCVVTGVSLTSITGATDVIAANSSATFTHNNVLSMSNASEDGCQGATFTIPVKITGASGNSASLL